MKGYPLADDLLRPLQRVAMPRAPVRRPSALRPESSTGGIVYAVARRNNRAFHCASPDDFAVLREHLRGMDRKYEVVLDAYTLMANHVHLLLQASTGEALGRPLRWVLTETIGEKTKRGRGA